MNTLFVYIYTYRKDSQIRERKALHVMAMERTPCDGDGKHSM